MEDEGKGVSVSRGEEEEEEECVPAPRGVVVRVGEGRVDPVPPHWLRKPVEEGVREERGEGEGGGDKEGEGVPVGVGVGVLAPAATPPGGVGVAKGGVPLGVPVAVGGTLEGVSEGRAVTELDRRGEEVEEEDKVPPAREGVRVRVGFTNEGVGGAEEDGEREGWESGVDDRVESREGVVPPPSNMMERVGEGEREGKGVEEAEKLRVGVPVSEKLPLF